MKKIVIDVRLSGLEHAGIGRYVETLSQHIELKVKSEKFKIEFVRVKPKLRHYTLAEQLKMPVYLNKLRPDLVHFPHFNVPLFYSKPFVVTVHDLLWHEQIGFEATTLSKWQYIAKYLGYRRVLRHAVRQARAVIVPTNWVKKQLLRRFPEVAGKVRVINEGVSELFITTQRPRIGYERLLEKYNLKAKEYLVYTGSLYPHKNVGILLNVLKDFSGLKLVVACARSVFWERFSKEVQKRGLSDQVVLAGFVPDEELVGLYQKALAFVFPSKSEGFGLPGLEAMAAGCPVISSNAGALPEIYGGAAVYFEPDDRRKLVGSIKKIRDDKDCREEMIEKGKRRAGKFTWGNCAEKTLDVYQEVV